MLRVTVPLTSFASPKRLMFGQTIHGETHESADEATMRNSASVDGSSNTKDGHVGVVVKGV